jgi:hypothetical protein
MPLAPPLPHLPSPPHLTITIALIAVFPLLAACGSRSGLDTDSILDTTAGSGGRHAGTSGHAGTAGSAGRPVDNTGGTAGFDGTGGYPSETGGYPNETGGSAGTAGTAGAGGLSFPPGSYDALLHDVQLTANPSDSMGAGPRPAVTPPSEKHYLRIDFRGDINGAPTAVVTPRWGDPVLFTGRWEDESLVLTGKMYVDGPPMPITARDLWHTLRFTSSDAPGVVATLHVTGSELISKGNLGWHPTATAEADVTPDALAPEARAEIHSPVGPPDQLLPWDPIGIRAAEPIAKLLTSPQISLTSTSSNGGPPSSPTYTWSVTEPNPAVDWAGNVAVWATPSTWNGLSGASAVITIHSQDVADLVGHPLPNTFTSAFRYVDLGRTVKEITFDGTAMPSGWGDLTHYGVETPSPLCESGGCVELGPFYNGDCLARRTGFAARMPYTDRLLRVRYLVLSADGPGGRNPNLDAGPIPFNVQTVSLGYSPTYTDIPFPVLHDLGPDAGELHWSSDYLTAEIDVSPVSGDDFGLVVYAGDLSRVDCAPSGTNPASGIKTAVIIDRIRF